jgi:hypothetical protein
MEEGPFGWLACTTNLEGAHLNLVDLLARHCSHGVGNFDDRLWGFSVILVSIGDLSSFMCPPVNTYLADDYGEVLRAKKGAMSSARMLTVSFGLALTTLTTMAILVLGGSLMRPGFLRDSSALISQAALT